MFYKQFKTFDKVLARHNSSTPWNPTFFSYYADSDIYGGYVCVDSEYAECISYEGNEDLAGFIECSCNDNYDFDGDDPDD